MIPFRTTAPGAQMPVVTMMLIVANIAVFLYQLGLPPRVEMAFTYTYALVPAVYTNPALAEHAGLSPYNYWPLLTNTFMHGGWLHLIFNMWTLWLFGVAVEGRMRTWRYLAFYLLCGVAGSVGHLLFNWDSTVPALGASGAIAGLLGGYARLFPGARVTLIQPIFIFPVIFSVPAIVYTAIWFALQIWQGTASVDGASGGGVAWFAHIGGFMAGLALVQRLGGRLWKASANNPKGLVLRPGPWKRKGPRDRKGPWQ
jgi:rhomboid family protein